MKILSILLQLLFSIDTIAAMIIYIGVSTWYGIAPQWKIFLFALIYSRIPDTDMIPYLVFKKKLLLKSHWPVGHHPAVYAAAIAVYTIVNNWLTGSSGMSYPVALFSFIVFAHFVHDSMQPQGMYWVWPFEWSRITLIRGFPQQPHQKDIAEKEAAQLKFGGRMRDEIANRIEEIPGMQIVVGVCVMYALWMWWYNAATPSL